MPKMSLAEIQLEIESIWRSTAQTYLDLPEETPKMSMQKPVELDAQTLKEIQDLLRPVLSRVCGRYFDDSTTYSEEMAVDIEADLLERLMVDRKDRDKLSSVVDVGSLYLVGQIREAIKDVPDNRRIMCQIVGEKTGVYNAYIEMAFLDRGDGPMILTAGHPELTHLPVCSDDTERNQKIDEAIEVLQKLR